MKKKYYLCMIQVAGSEQDTGILFSRPAPTLHIEQAHVLQIKKKPN